MRRMRSVCCAASGQAAVPPRSVMNSRRFTRSNCIRSPPARAGLQDSELGRISQRARCNFATSLGSANADGSPPATHSAR